MGRKEGRYRQDEEGRKVSFLWRIWIVSFFFSKELNGIVFNKKAALLVCSTVEQNLIFIDVNSLATTKQFAGSNDEIFDISFVSHELNCIAIAANSPQLRIYDLSSFNCTLVEG